MSAPPSSVRLGFAGTPDFAVAALVRLSQSYKLAAVFTQPDRPAGRGQTLKVSPVKRAAQELDLPVHQPASFKSADALELLRGLNLDVLVVAAYGLILPPAALAMPRWGCINIHASLLPRWRGAAPIQRALLAGDASTGITIMRMEAGLDTGPMMASSATPIGERDTAKSLHDRLSNLGAELIAETLQSLVAGTVSETAQPMEGVTYAEKLNKAEARIDWRDAAARLSRQVRAFNPWPVAETQLNGEQLRIWDAEALPMADDVPANPGTVVAAAEQGIDVACGQGMLRVHRLQLAGRKPLTAPEFLKGQRLSGARFASL